MKSIFIHSLNEFSNYIFKQVGFHYVTLLDDNEKRAKHTTVLEMCCVFSVLCTCFKCFIVISCPYAA